MIHLVPERVFLFSEEDSDVRRTASHFLAGCNGDRHPAPSRRIYFQAERSRCLCQRLRVDERFLVVAAILPYPYILDPLASEEAQAAEHLYLFLVDRGGLQALRLIHSGKGEQLERVILQHIADRSGLLIILAALADTGGLIDRDIDALDVARIPDRLEYGIGEAERQEVLHHPFGQIMIEAIDLLFVEGARVYPVDLLRRWAVETERFF